MIGSFGIFSDGTFSDGMLSDGMFSDRPFCTVMFSDGIFFVMGCFSDGTFCMLIVFSPPAISAISSIISDLLALITVYSEPPQISSYDITIFKM